MPLAHHLFAGSLVFLGALHVIFGEQLARMMRMLIQPLGPVGWSEMGESLAFSAMAFLLAAGRRGRHLPGPLPPRGSPPTC